MSPHAIPYLLGLVPALCFAGAATPAQGDAPRRKRVRIRPDVMRHETGHCYIAGMDFGEAGDKATRNTSGLRVFEDGKPLGPARSVHQDIRIKGEGRYSHWTHNALYFCASDNSDPKTNGRVYKIDSTNPDSMLWGLEALAEPPRHHTEVVRTSQHDYSISLGGKLDFENSHTRHNSNFAVTFQPNISLTIENTGEKPVVWPKIIANDRADWGTFDSLLAEFTRGATNDQEKALFIWQTARDNRYHETPLFADDEFHDPVKMFNSYGLNLCDDMGYGGCSLFKHAGLGKPKYKIDPKVRCLHGHVQAEAVVDNRHQFLDIDESVFHLDRENERPVSGDACARDHDLVRREVHYGPVFRSWSDAEANAALFGADDATTYKALRGHSMRYVLRPREKAVFRWDNIGKWACQSKKWNNRPKYFGNSKFVYEPRLSPEHYSEGVREAVDVVSVGTAPASLAGASPDGKLVYDVDIPWAMCGGTVTAEFAGLSAEDGFALDLVLKGGKPTRVWEGKGPGDVIAEAQIDSALRPHVSPAKYHYALVVTLSSCDAKRGARLKSLRIETDVMAAPLSLPRLRRGRNSLVYTDRTEGPHEITITHEWQECHGVVPPAPPAKPTYPEPDATIRDSLVTFRWPAVEGCETYHLQVSRRQDFRIPYRPSYDVIIRATEWCVPYTGMFAPDTPYYWRLRSRSGKGVWGEWSPTWRFRWQGPRVPVNLRRESVPGGFVLHWEPNPRGTRPVAYEVYGSDEKGFSVHKSEHQSYTRGKAPANFLARTEETSMLVVSAEPKHANMNRCYYRVVAVDEHGTESICSDFVEMPHPHIWSKPPETVKLGEPFVYEPGLICSLGDVQHHYEKPGNQFWDIEKTTFALVRGPKWMTINPETGRLTGTPAATGRADVEVGATNQFKGETRQRFVLVVK